MESHPRHIAAIRKNVENFCALHGLSEMAVAEVGLCLNEALANIIRHAYEGATDKPIAITAEIADGELLLSIRDWGNGVDPTLRPPPPYDPLTPGGLGLICLKRLTDDVRYTPQPDGMLLTIRKRKTVDSSTPGADSTKAQT
ncbi:MAG TPA: ATP-binding protein [Tepidisphaeraceae bacterium]